MQARAQITRHDCVEGWSAIARWTGAPLRLRLERQLGYKQAKYVMRIELVDSVKGFGSGQGGYWEDRGYEWYAGI